MNFIKGDSLLSSISNISMLMKAGDNSSLFNFSMFHNRNDTDLSQKLYEVKINDICPEADQLYDTVLDRSVKQEEREEIVHYSSALVLPQFTYNHGFNERAWMITQQKGVSEDEKSEEEEEKEKDVVVEEKKLKNETKNIPKNYGKAIISFMEKYRQRVSEICSHTGVPFEEFYEEMLETKKSINTIADLRRLWVDYKYAKCMRIVSGLFLRKYSMSYIFNSRISNFRSHIKYRHRICEAIKDPQKFRHIKDY